MIVNVTKIQSCVLQSLVFQGSHAALQCSCCPLSQMEILCEHQQFRVMVDGQPLCGFAHRIQKLASLTALKVWGDMQLTKVA